MKNTIVLMALIGCAILASCSDDISLNAEKNLITIQTTVDAYSHASSRTQVGSVQDDGSLRMLWSPNDKIGVYGDGRNNVAFTNVNTEANETAAFSGSYIGEPQYAFYPYTSGATNKQAIPVEIATEQDYIDPTSIANYDIKAGSISSSEDGAYTLQFNQLASLVRFEINLKGVEGLTLAEGETLESIQLQAKKALTGEFTLNLENNILTESNTFKTLIIQFPDGYRPSLTALDQTIVAYAVVVPGEHEGDEWECDITTSHHWIQFWTDVKADLVQGTYSVLPLNAAVLANSYHYENDDYQNPISGPHIEDFESEGGDEPSEPSDPSVETPAPANCYIVESAGTYVFDATVIGNGQDGIISNVGFHTTSATISPNSVELLWQDTPGFITAVSLDASTGIVSYTTGGNVGNAQIAVKDNYGTILWSWHIWGIGDRAIEDEIITNRAGNEFQVMDRTLGQLHKLTISDITAEDGSIYTYTYHKTNPTLSVTVGDIYPLSNQAVLYQWGRKDPIPSATTYYDIDNNPTDITTYPVIKPSVATDATIAYSVQYPNYFIDLYSLVGNGVWLSEENNCETLWGDVYTDDKNYTDADAATGWTHGKTIYDPCPAGYRVANRFMQTGFMVEKSDDNKASFVNDNDAITDITNYMNVIVTTYLTGGTTTRYAPVYSRGYFFGKNTDDTTVGTYFPQVPYRQAGGGFSKDTTTSYYWTSSPSDNYNNGRAWNFTGFEKTNSSMTGSLQVGYTYQKRCALPVRCVREQSVLR